MATQTPRRWIAEPTVDADKIRNIVSWYEEALGDEDKASSIEDASWYWGQRVAYESVLDLLHDQLPRPDPRTREVRALVLLANVMARAAHGQCEICGSFTDLHYEEDCFK